MPDKSTPDPNSDDNPEQPHDNRTHLSQNTTPSTAYIDRTQEHGPGPGPRTATLAPRTAYASDLSSHFGPPYVGPAHVGPAHGGPASGHPQHPHAEDTGNRRARQQPAPEHHTADGRGAQWITADWIRGRSPRPRTRPRPRTGQGPEDPNHGSPNGTITATARAEMNKDSAVLETRESLPDGKNADAASYIKDSTRSKDPLYGPISGETQHGQHQAPIPTAPPRRARPPYSPLATTRTTRHSSAGMVDFANESRENRKLLLASRTASVNNLDDRVDGREASAAQAGPSITPTTRTSSSPPAMSRLPVQARLHARRDSSPCQPGPRRGPASRPDRLGDLDAETNDREWTLQADRIVRGGQAEGEGRPRRELGGVQGRQSAFILGHTFSGARYRREPAARTRHCTTRWPASTPNTFWSTYPLETGNGSDQFDSKSSEDPEQSRPLHRGRSQGSHWSARST